MPARVRPFRTWALRGEGKPVLEVCGAISADALTIDVLARKFVVPLAAAGEDAQGSWGDVEDHESVIERIRVRVQIETDEDGLFAPCTEIVITFEPARLEPELLTASESAHVLGLNDGAVVIHFRADGSHESTGGVVAGVDAKRVTN